MILLSTGNESQDLFVIPRRISTYNAIRNWETVTLNTDILLEFIDDTTNEVVGYIPSYVIDKDYIKITNTFNLTEGRFYDLNIYEISGRLRQFDQRVIKPFSDKTDDYFTNRQCIYNFLESQDLVADTDLNLIYKDKVFCTSQNVDQLENEYYDENKNEYTLYNGSDKKYIVR